MTDDPKPDVDPEPEVEAEEEMPAPVVLDLPGVQLMMPNGTNVQVAVQENGDKMVVVGPFLLQIVLPFSDEGARAFAQELTGGIVPVRSISDVDRRAGELIVRR